MKKQIFLALTSSIFVFAGSSSYTFDMVPEYEKVDNTKVSGSIGAYYESYSGKKSYNSQKIKVNMQAELGSGFTTGIEASGTNGSVGFEGMHLSQMWVETTI